jgi:HD-GYP domain-containing protein (c-di-GMP phosphodiesterase class II)
VITERILEQVPGFSELARLASSHHERLDGHGYPRGLTAPELTMPMRVLAIADVYDALTAQRPYRPACSPQQALEIIHNEVPRRLDSDAFAALQTLATSRRAEPEEIGQRR